MKYYVRIFIILIQVIHLNNEIKPGVGLSDDRGNTCFFHSALQALYHTPIFRHAILYASYQQSQDPEYGKFIQTFIDLLQKMQTSTATVDSGKLYDEMMKIAKEKKRFPSRNNPPEYGYRGAQHDVDEAIKLMLEVIGDSKNNELKKTFDIFKFSTQTKIKRNCGHETLRAPSIISSIDVVAGCYDAFGNYLPCKTLIETLNAYFSEEIVSNVECYECSLINKKKPRVNVREKKIFYELPPILTIVIKRNYPDFNNPEITKKANHPIDFETKLDLAPYLSDNLKKVPQNKVVTYNLVAISCHSGSSSGGHYITYAKEGSMWWYFSDSIAHTVQESGVKNSGATDVTLLFYERDDLQKKLQDLKTSLQRLKAKLQALLVKLGVLKGKLSA